MPLSDREQQILSDIESRLREEDPKFARTVSTADVSSGARRAIKIAIAGFVVGFLMLLATVPAGSVVLGVAGFVVMLASVVLAGHQLKRLGAEGGGDLSGQLRGGLQRYMGDRRGERTDEQRDDTG